MRPLQWGAISNQEDVMKITSNSPRGQTEATTKAPKSENAETSDSRETSQSTEHKETKLPDNANLSAQRKADQNLAGVIQQAFLKIVGVSSDAGAATGPVGTSASGLHALSENEAPASPETFQPNRNVVPEWNVHLGLPTDFLNVYNPVGPPGLGDLQPGQEIDGGHEDIDWRKVVDSEMGSDGSKTFFYEGELNDSGFLGISGETNFAGMERLDPNGRLLERHVTYDSGVTIFLKSDGRHDNDQIKLEKIRKLDTTFDPKTGLYNTVATREDGFKYSFQTRPDGQVVDFKHIGQSSPINPDGTVGNLKEGLRRPSEKMKDLMKDYDPEAGNADEIAEKIAADPALLHSLTREQRLQLVRGLFDGHTTEAEEDAAKNILLSAKDRGELQSLVNELGWDELSSELDDEDIAEIKSKLARPPALANGGEFLKNTSPAGSTYNVLKPPGLGELEPGKEITDTQNGIARRKVKWQDTPSGGRKLTYDGNLEGIGFLVGGPAFHASEEYDAEGRLVFSSAVYDPPIEVTFRGSATDPERKMKDVLSVVTERKPDGTYWTRVTQRVEGREGPVYAETNFQTDAQGRPIKIDYPTWV